LHFQGEFTKKCNIKLQLLNATTSKRLEITQAQLQEISYAPEHSQEISNAQAQLQETSIDQAHKQETSNQTELQRSLFEFEHLIYNQSGVHNTNQIQTLKTLEFLRYEL